MEKDSPAKPNTRHSSAWGKDASSFSNACSGSNCDISHWGGEGQRKHVVGAPEAEAPLTPSAHWAMTTCPSLPSGRPPPPRSQSLWRPLPKSWPLEPTPHESPSLVWLPDAPLFPPHLHAGASLPGAPLRLGWALWALHGVKATSFT